MIRFTIDPRSRPFVYEITTANPAYEPDDPDAMLAAYDVRGGVRGKYFWRYHRWLLVRYLRALFR
jgi:hypothetical protein